MKTKLLTISLLSFCFLLNAQTLKLTDSKMDIGPGTAMTTAEIINDDPEALMIRSDETGSGSLIYTNTNNPEPHATVEIWVGETEQWHLVSPVTSNTMSGDFYIDGTQPTGLMWYNENIDIVPPPAPNVQYGWTDILDLDEPIKVGQGYGYYQDDGQRSAETGKVTFTGQLTSQDADYGPGGYDLLPFSGPPTSFYGWTLLGNPYSAAIMEGAGTPADGEYIEPAVWVWKGGEHNNYIVWRLPEGGDGEHPIVIPMGQAFFMHSLWRYAELTLFSDIRTHNTTPIYKKSEDIVEKPYGTITLDASNSTALDQLLIEIPLDEIGEEDRRESISKLFGPSESPQLYTTEADRQISIQTYNSFELERVIDVAYLPGDDGEQKFNFEIDLPELSEVYLEDLATGWMQNVIEEPEYIFLGDPEDNADRFRIHFTLSPDDIETIGLEKDLNIYGWEKAVYINNPNPVLGSSSLVRIYDMYGKTVYSGKLHLHHLTSIPVLVNSSYLVVKIRNGDEVITETVFIQ